MEYISSDTNVWIDFFVIDRIGLPFYLPYTYIMSADAIDDEVLSPIGLRKDLLRYGLERVEITIEEFDIAFEFGRNYPRLRFMIVLPWQLRRQEGLFCLLAMVH